MKIQLSEHFTYKKLIRFTLPTIIMMIFTSIYGVVDGIFISNCAGSNAFAAVNLIMPAIMILGSVGFMIGTGGSALVSKTLGEGDNEKANKYFSMLTYLLIISGVILIILGFIFIKPVAIWLGAEGEILNYAIIYGKTILIAVVPFLLQNSFQSFLVVAEKPQMGLIISICTGITNMILDYLFVYILKMSVFGAALATGISQIIGGIIPLVYFIRKNNSHLQLVKAKFELKAIIKTCSNGSSEMLTNISMSLVNMLYNMQLMKIIGANGVSAYGIIMYVGFIFIGIYLGYGIGSAPIISYHYGAGNKEELKNLLKRSIKLLGITALVLTLSAEVLSKILGSIFVKYDAELLEVTVTAIRLYSISYLISWFNIFASSFFTALNNGPISAIISFMKTVFEVTMIFVLPTMFGLNGVWLAIVVAHVLSFIISSTLLLYNRKRYGYI